MSENLSITKEQLVSLLKAAHAAYKEETRPPDTAGTSWINWYVDYVVTQLQKPDVPDTNKLSSPADKVSTAKLPDLPEEKSEKAAEEPKAESPQPVASEVKAEQNAAKPAESSPPPAASTAKTSLSSAVTDSKPSQPAAQTNALQVCPTCAHRNRPGVLFCDNCGTNLLTGSQAAVGTRDLREAQDMAASSVSEAVKKPNDTENLQLGESEVQAVRTAGSSTFAGDMVLRIEVDGGATPIVIKPKAEDMILGRRDPTTGATPEVDLTSYAGYRMGVSRRHASLALENNRLNLWDLGSSNGTFINGTRLTPHQPSPLRDGDEVRLGQMVLRLFFQKSTPNKETTST